MESNLISSIAWISKGFAKKVPKDYDFDEEDIKEMKLDPLASKKSLIIYSFS
jgi:hypothetical protein